MKGKYILSKSYKGLRIDQIPAIGSKLVIHGRKFIISNYTISDYGVEIIAYDSIDKEEYRFSFKNLLKYLMKPSYTSIRIQ